MAIEMIEEFNAGTQIKVIGVGGGGGNAVEHMIAEGVQGVEFVCANTDAQALNRSAAHELIQLGTTGLGAGARPEAGRAAAEEAIDRIRQAIDGAHMLFITAGMGGGTGTGAAPVIARVAKEMGILTVGVVTKPFQFEGRHRMRLADAGVIELQRYVDTLIVIPNQNLFRVANERTTFGEAFAMADQVLHSGVRSITDLMVLPGLINLDFADVRTVMTEMGKAMMGTGEASGEDRALTAAQNAIQNPLLDEVSLRGAKAVLVNVTGGPDMTLLEVDEAANAIASEVDPDGNIIFGAAFDPTLEGKIRVSVVATGMDSGVAAAVQPAPRAVQSQPAARVQSAPPAAAATQAERPIVSPLIHRAAPEAPAPMAAAPAPEPAPQIAPKIIVDPMVEDHDSDLDYEPAPVPRIATPRYPLPPTTEIVREPPRNPLPDPRAPPEPRRGFMSLFGGRPRYDAPAAPAPQVRLSGGGAQPQQAEVSEHHEDLEIPSFLRRLAN